MRPCRSEWLLALCLITVQLLAPMVFEGLLVGAKDMEPPPLTPALIKQADAVVNIFPRICYMCFRFVSIMFLYIILYRRFPVEM